LKAVLSPFQDKNVASSKRSKGFPTFGGTNKEQMSASMYSSNQIPKATKKQNQLA